MSIALAVPDTSGRILDIAERLVQMRGFNGFSYADIAVELRITKASLHYHFSTKTRLGERLVERYQVNFLAVLANIDKTDGGVRSKLDAYVAIYADVLKDGRMCLCGMLAADYTTLPESIKIRVRKFFDANEAWLTGLLSRGRVDKQLTFAGPPVESARFLVSALEGAMLLARSYEDPDRFTSFAARLLDVISVGTQSTATRSIQRRLRRQL